MKSIFLSFLHIWKHYTSYEQEMFVVCSTIRYKPRDVEDIKILTSGYTNTTYSIQVYKITMTGERLNTVTLVLEHGLLDTH